MTLNFTNPEMQRQTTAETRRPLVVPTPPEGASKKLKDEYKKLQDRTDALQTDKNHAALQRSAFLAELNALTEHAKVESTAKESKGKPKTGRTVKAIAEETGVVDFEEDRSITWEATQVRDIAIGLLRKELSLRSNLEGYLERWRAEGGKCVAALRSKLEETRAAVMAWLVKGDAKLGGYVDPAVDKLSGSRVLPGMIETHPAVFAVRSQLQAAISLQRSESHAGNRQAISQLQTLIRNEAASLAGLPR